MKTETIAEKFAMQNLLDQLIEKHRRPMQGERLCPVIDRAVDDMFCQLFSLGRRCRFWNKEIKRCNSKSNDNG